ncbi:MAG: hypothetical protein WKF47_01610 [Geodermatophilaceae bacterium]
MTLSFEREYIVASRQCQDLEGDVATVVEESAVGIRIIKALGRRQLIGGRFLREARRLRTASLGKVRILAKFWSILDIVPQVLLGRRPALRRPRGCRRATSASAAWSRSSRWSSCSRGRSRRWAGSSRSGRSRPPRPTGCTRCSTPNRRCGITPGAGRSRRCARSAAVRGA